MMRNKLNMVALATAFGIAACNGRNLESNVRIVNGDVNGENRDGYDCYGENKIKAIFKEEYPDSDLKRASDIIFKLHESPMGSLLLDEKYASSVEGFWKLSLKETLNTIHNLAQKSCSVNSTYGIVQEIAELHKFETTEMPNLEKALKNSEEVENKKHIYEQNMLELMILKKENGEQKNEIGRLKKMLNISNEEIGILKGQNLLLKEDKEKMSSLQEELNEKMTELEIAKIELEEFKDKEKELSQQVNSLMGINKSYKEAYDKKVEAEYILSKSFKEYENAKKEADANFFEIIRGSKSLYSTTKY